MKKFTLADSNNQHISFHSLDIKNKIEKLLKAVTMSNIDVPDLSWLFCNKKSSDKQSLLPNNALLLFSILLSAFFFVYIIVFLFLKTITDNSFQLLLTASPALSSLAALYLTAHNQFRLARFITTYLVPLNIVILSFYNPLLNFSQIILLYGIVFIFLYKSKTKLLVAFAYLSCIYLIIQYRYITTEIATADYTAVKFELIIKGLFDAFILVVLLRVKREFELYKEQVLGKKEMLEQKNQSLQLLMTKSAEQNDRLKKTVLLKEKLITVISHDIRLPLSTLKSIISNYEKGAVGNEAALEGIVDIQKDLECVDKMINDLVGCSDMPGRKEKQVSFTSANEIIDSVIGLYALSAKNKNIVLAYENAGQNAEDQSLNINKKDLAILARNLLSNAIKFSHPGTVINISLKNTSAAAIAFTVKDEGIGMAECRLENLKKTCNAFSRGTQNETGLGIGLSLVLDVINQNNLVYDIQSEAGKGTEFSITIPAISPAA